MSRLSASIRHRLKFQHHTLFELTDGKDLSLKPDPSKWSVFEQIVHLAAYQPSFFHRIKLILETDEPTFQRYEAAKDPLFHDFLQLQLSDLESIITRDRQEIITLLFSLTEVELDRGANHPLYGHLDIVGWTEFFLIHEAHHLFAIFRMTRYDTMSQQQ